MIVPESYAPVLLQQRASHVRHATRNWAIHAKVDEKEVDFHEIAVKYLYKPFKMLLLEPILDLITIYISLIYGELRCSISEVGC